MDDGIIDAEKLHENLIEHVAHRMPYLPYEIATMPLKKFVMASAFLPLNIRLVLGGGSVNLNRKTAAEFYDLRPPQLATVKEVRSFLECSQNEWDWLLKKKYVTLPQAEHNFDADQVMDAKSRLAMFYTFHEMDVRFGVPGLTERLVENKILHDVSGYRNSYYLVDMHDVGQVLDHIRTACIQSGLPKSSDAVRVSETAFAKAHPERAYANLFGRLLDSVIPFAEWRPPYRLNDFWITSNELSLLSSTI
ncbi:hypothetical protein ACFQPC_00390 [Herminiimonas glaciei]|uniref:Uncharacterized protein n=1 Tax=Herminiimonas glaciei TaxID=523788 RepID=A0ABW2I685_9BURK